MIFFGDLAIGRIVSEFALHYHTERNHEGLENKIIQPEFEEFADIGAIRSRQRLGGLLRYYREAAWIRFIQVFGQHAIRKRRQPLL